MNAALSPTTREALGRTIRSLEPVAGECASYEAEEILQHVLGCSRSALYLWADRPFSAELLARLDSIVGRRATGRPLPYVLGTSYFHSMEATVSPEVLIPRPDTEVLVQTILDREHRDSLTFADIGTGSGVIAAVLLHHRTTWHAVATDISFGALRIAGYNVGSRASLVRADRLTALKTGSVDFIVSNPPYIAETELPGLEASVRDYEPVEALSGGKVDITVGSALDIFGGSGIRYAECVAFNARRGGGVPGV